MATLAELLAGESTLVSGFITALGEEQIALTHGNVEALAAIQGGKAKLAEQLNGLETERNTTLDRAGFTAGRPGMEAWLAAHPADKVTAGQWAQLLKLAGEARELNILNGKLIALRLQATSQALATLTQEAQKTGLYGPDGQAAPRTGSRIIDAA